MNNLKLAKIVAFRSFGSRRAYEPSGDVEKMMGEILTQELGIGDASEEFFEKAKSKLDDALDEAGEDLDMEDDDVYPHLQRTVMEVADEMGMIK